LLRTRADRSTVRNIRIVRLSGIFEGYERSEAADVLAKAEQNFVLETLDVDLDIIDAQ